MKLFKMAYCVELADTLRNGTGLASYAKQSFELVTENCIDAAIETVGELPQLDVRDDTAAAIAVHKYLGNLNELEASDKRLWTTLTHVTFRSYVMERWPAKSDDEAARRNAILRRWFAEGGSDRTLENNAIARLWWGAHLTYAPWKTNPDEFGYLEKEDEYYLTKRLFSLQELIKVTMESSLGRSSKVLIALLSFLNKNERFVNNDDVGDLMKELNLISGASKVLVLGTEDLEALIADTANELFAETVNI